jgi:hypothetical protein
MADSSLSVSLHRAPGTTPFPEFVTDPADAVEHNSGISERDKLFAGRLYLFPRNTARRGLARSLPLSVLIRGMLLRWVGSSCALSRHSTAFTSRRRSDPLPVETLVLLRGVTLEIGAYPGVSCRGSRH